MQEEAKATCSGGVQVAWLLERKDRLLRQLVEARPQQYVETVGLLQSYANRLLVIPGLFRLDPGQLQCVANLYGHERTVTSLVIANGDLVSASTDGFILLWDLEHSQPRRKLKDPSVTAGCRCMAVTVDGWLLASYEYGPINMWDVTSGKVMNRIVTDHTGIIEAMAIADVNRAAHVMALSQATSPQTTEDIRSPDALRAAAEEARRKLLLQMDSRVPVLITASADSTLKIWDLETLDGIATLQGHCGKVTCVLVVGTLIFSGSEDRTILTWDTNQSGFPNINKWEGHQGSVNALTFTKADLILSGSQDTTIGIWSISQSKKLTALEGHSAAVSALARVDEDYIISSSTDQCIKLWSLSELTCLQTFPCSALCLLSVNNLIFTGGSSNLIKLYTSVTLVLNQNKYGHFEPPTIDHTTENQDADSSIPVATSQPKAPAEAVDEGRS